MKNMNEKKQKAKAELFLPLNFWRGSASPAIFLFSALLTCAIVFFHRPLDPQNQEFLLGEPARRAYFSPVAFSYEDAKKTEELRATKAKTAPPVYQIDSKINKRILDQTELFFQIVDEAYREKMQNGESRWKKLPFQLPPSSLSAFQDKRVLELVRAGVFQLLDYYLSQGVLSSQERFRLYRMGDPALVVVKEGSSEEETRKGEEVLTKELALERVEEKLSPEVTKNRTAQAMVLQIMNAVLTENLFLNDEKTQALRKKITEAVAPVEILIKKKELIVPQGMLVNEEIKRRLDLIHQKLMTQQQRTQVFAGALVIFGLFLLSFFYLSIFETKISASLSNVTLFHVLMVTGIFFCKGITLWPEASPYLMPTALAPFLLTLLLNNRIGIWSGAMMVVFCGFLSGFRVDMMVGTLFASMTATFLAYHLRKRVHFFRVGLGIGSAYFLTLLGFQLTHNVAFADAFTLASFGFANALLTVILCWLLLPLFESLFDVVTDVTLLELSDLNHPLIKEMMLRAPGTYHHSLIVGSLAEHACEQIGANALLARVGCYFHDIGKIERPEYFLENQGYLYPNLHDPLPPLMSYEIIVSHVRHGIRLSRQYKLKKAIVNFITEHQGTGVIYFFYKKSMDQALPTERILAEDFRYPGPKPQSKETAVVLLADSTEAASRSLNETTPEAIQLLVRKVINDKFIDGQLDECELTLLDLHRIQESFVRNLSAMFHTRMRYPAMEKEPGAPDLFEENQFSKFRVNNGQ